MEVLDVGELLPRGHRVVRTTSNILRMDDHRPLLLEAKHGVTKDDMYMYDGEVPECM